MHDNHTITSQQLMDRLLKNWQMSGLQPAKK